MPIFGRQKDRELIKHFSKEVLQDILDTPVLIYKPFITRTNTNMYGEGVNGDKNYRPGVLLHAIINREDQEWTTDTFGIDIEQKGSFTFLNEDIWKVAATGSDESDGFAIEIGDLIYYDAQYWEIDTTVKNQYLHGRNQNIIAGDGVAFGFADETDMHGESLSTVAQAHITRRSRINVETSTSGPSTTPDASNNSQGLYR
jgi:hypothetical protein|tara:strand:+ start:2961 stop:3560 length:600 start_codon:yes stop_codon:yes gene_type:complete